MTLTRLPRCLAACVAALALSGVAAGCGQNEDEAGTANAGAEVGAALPEAAVSAIHSSRERLLSPAAADFDAPSLTFPPSTTYGEALREYLLIEFTGKTVSVATLGPPLPRGVVLGRAGAGRDRLLVSLAAPFGYDPATGRALSIPPFVAPAADEGKPDRRSSNGPWLAGSALPVPTLPGCMVSTRLGDAVARCGPADIPTIDDAEAPLPLP